MKKYNEEFKLQALKLAEELGPIEAARQLGVSDSNIYAWRARYSTLNPVVVKNDETKSVDLAKENLRLQQEINQLKKINHVLKSAAAFFSQDHLK